MALSKSQRAAVFAMFGGKCAYCGCDLPERGWHADHIEPVERDWWHAHRLKYWEDHGRVGPKPESRGLSYPERDCVENMFPACRTCNLDKHCMSLETWRRWIEDKPNVLKRNNSAYRHAERFGIVAVVQPKVVFYFERIAAPGETKEESEK